MLLIIEGGRQNASCIFICISGNEHNQFASRQYHLVPNTTYFKLKLSQLYKYRAQPAGPQAHAFLSPVSFKRATYVVTV